MAAKFYNRKNFAAELSAVQIRKLEEKRARFDAIGEVAKYDVFLSHSTKDMTLIKRIRDVLEDSLDISVYIDWDEDSGTSRDEIADAVKNAMNRSTSFLVVKTDNSDDSSWVSWETGYFDKKDSDKIDVLLVEDDDKEFNSETFRHQEYLKNYIILGPNDIVDFIKNGSSYIKGKTDLVNAPFVVVKPEEMVRPHRDDQLRN